MRTINIHSREESAHWAQSTRRLANPVNMKVVHACSHLEKAQQECMKLSHTHMHHNLLWAWETKVGGVGVYPATWVCGHLEKSRDVTQSRKRFVGDARQQLAELNSIVV